MHTALLHITDRDSQGGWSTQRSTADIRGRNSEHTERQVTSAQTISVSVTMSVTVTVSVSVSDNVSNSVNVSVSVSQWQCQCQCQCRCQWQCQWQWQWQWQCQMSVSVSKTLMGITVCRDFKLEAPLAEEMLDCVVCSQEQFSFQMCLESGDGSGTFRNRRQRVPDSWCRDSGCRWKQFHASVC